MLVACTLGLWAVPAKRITMRVQQPDGTFLTLTQAGDEFFHYLMTDDGVVVKKQGDAYFYAAVDEGRVVASKQLAHPQELRTPQELVFAKYLPEIQELRHTTQQRADMPRRVQATRAPQKAADVPTSGEVHVPLLLVQYSDVKFVSDDPKAAFEGHINGDDYKAEGGYGSVKEYFEDQSEGKFVPKFEVIGPITLKNKMEYYGANDAHGSDLRPLDMIREACAQADNLTDFSKFDNNGDGYVDVVYVIYAGYGEASNVAKLENTIWPHQWYLDTPLSLDGVKISKYACNNELDGDSGSQIDGIGTFCHEFSHCLGLPDFYPTDDSNGFGMESWSVMHYGCYNNNGHTPCGYTGYEKDFLGWKELIVIDSPQDVTLSAMSEGGDAYKIVNDVNPNEYYVVENHQRTKWDANTPAEGMLVIHVDYLESAWQNNIVNNYPSHQRMTIIPADNKLTKDSQSGDTYPGSSGNTELTSESKPAATVYQGEFMGKDITDIQMTNGVVTFSYMKGALEVPVLLEATDVTESGFTMAWERVPGIKEYEVRLDMLEESPYMLEEDFERVKANNSDIGAILDSYTMQPGWQGAYVYGLDGAIRVGSASERGALVTPYLRTDSTCFTVLYTIRKSASTDKDAGMVLCVTDDEWLDKDGYNELYGYGLTVDNDEWITYFIVLDTIGNNSYLYIDTRDFGQTAGGNSTRVDINDLYVLEGDLTEELTGGSKAPQRKVGAKRHPAPTRVAEEVNVNAVVARNNVLKTRTGDTEESEKRYSATTLYTGLTTELDYRFDDLDGGLYRCMVRSVRDSLYSRYSEAVDVLLVDSLLPQTAATFTIYIDKDSVYMETDSVEAVLYYTTDGTTPTSYSTRYDGPFALSGKATVYAIAREAGHRRSDVVGKRNWFTSDGATYRITSDVEPQVLLTEAYDGNSGRSYAGHFVVPKEVERDSLMYAVVGLEEATFRNATGMRSVEIAGDRLDSIGGSLFHGCTALNAVIWDVPLPLTAEMFDEESYNNLLVYLPEDMSFTHPLVDAGRMTLVQGGVSGALKLNERFSFYCPRAFTAESVSYSRTFTQSTGLGTSAGWETLALPFDVQRVAHSVKGELVPFGVDGDRHFWLSEMTSGGFVPATAIQANTPYILSVPNNTNYGDNSLSGVITFSADNAVIHCTDEPTVAGDAQFDFMLTYEKIEANDSVYALNVGTKYGEFAAGSVFVPGNYAVNPFSAYLLPQATAQRAPMYRIQPQEEVEETVAAFEVLVDGGVVYILSPESRSVVVYDMTGRQVCVVECRAGVNEVPHLQEGIYLIEKNKIYVQR